MKKINNIEYFLLCDILLNKVKNTDIVFDCIVSLKRSGWILGAYFSNKLDIPVFTESEITSIPNKYKNILVLDDKTQKGKSMRHCISKLNNHISDNVKISTAAIFIKDSNKFITDIYVREESDIILFYEN